MPNSCEASGSRAVAGAEQEDSQEELDCLEMEISSACSAQSPTSLNKTRRHGGHRHTERAEHDTP